MAEDVMALNILRGGAYSGIYMGESQMATQVSLSGGDRRSDTDGRRGGNVTSEADTEGMQPRA